MKLDKELEVTLNYVQQMENTPRVEYTEGDITKEMMEITNSYSIED